MTEFSPIDHTSHDVRVCVSPSDRAELGPMLERLVELARSPRQTSSRTVARAESLECTRRVPPPPARFVSDNGPEFSPPVLESAVVRLRSRGGFRHC